MTSREELHQDDYDYAIFEVDISDRDRIEEVVIRFTKLQILIPFLHGKRFDMFHKFNIYYLF